MQRKILQKEFEPSVNDSYAIRNTDIKRVDTFQLLLIYIVINRKHIFHYN